MPAEPPSVFLVEAEDTQTNAMAIIGLNSLSHHRLALSVTPGSRGDGLTFLARDLLGALGKSLLVSGAGRTGGNEWASVRPWLIGEGIRDVIILRASLLPPTALSQLSELAADVGACLWVVSLQEAFSSESWRVLSSRVSEHVSWDQFIDTWADEPASDCGGIGRQESSPYPTVPRDDFPTFRASARDLLDADSFAVVDRAYVDQMRHAKQWFAREPISEESVAGYLRSHALSRTVDEALTRLRAVQGALFLYGWYVKVEPAQVMGRLQLATRPDMTIDTINRLRRYRDTSRASIGLLFSLADRDLPEFVALTISDVANDGSTVAFNSGVVSIPTVARPLLLAHRSARIGAGAQPDSALYSNADGKPWRVRRFMTVLRQIAEETGLGVVPWHASYGGLPAAQWAQRYGISVMRVAS